MTDGGVEATVACALHAASQSRARPCGVGLLGISVGTTLALLAAAEAPLRQRVSVVAGLAGYTDLTDLIRLATAGTYREGGVIREYPAGPFLSLCVANSVCAALEPGPARDRIAAMQDVPFDRPDPLAGLRRLDTAGISGEEAAALALLVNRDSRRFDQLYAALPERLRLGIERLSPVRCADRLHVPVEILVDPRDKYFPLEQTLALARASPFVHVTVTSALAHADSRLSLRRAQDAVRLAAFAGRALAAARIG